MNELNEEATVNIIEDLIKLGYQFSRDWFTKNLIIWIPLLDEYKPTRILEIGAFEGLSTIFLIDKCTTYGNTEIYTVDTWEGGVEHANLDFNIIEDRFDNNVQLAAKTMAKNPVSVSKAKGTSLVELSKMVAVGIPKFDLVYVDGSHLAPDVLVDAVLSFNLLRVGGLMIFDDYHSPNPMTPEFPMLGIESFLATYKDKVQKITFVDQSGNSLESDGKVLYQLYLKKVAD